MVDLQFGFAVDEARDDRHERRGVLVLHVRVECRLVAPRLDTDDAIGVADVGGEGLHEASVVVLRGGGDVGGGAHDLVAQAGAGTGGTDHDDHRTVAYTTVCGAARTRRR